MKIKEIYNLAIKMGSENDFRGKTKIKKILERRKKKFEKMPVKEKKYFPPVLLF